VPETAIPTPLETVPTATVANLDRYGRWLRSNVTEQKQKGFYSVGIKVLNGDLKTAKARILAEIVQKYAADDMRVTIHQDLLLKYVRPEYLNALYNELDALGLAEAGFEKTADVTSCPGTDSCNLAISNSTGITRALEKVILNEYSDFVESSDIKIKISGCMNACGQHAMAQIGFHGSSLRTTNGVIPSLQVLLGGGTVGDGVGRISDKVIKVPSKRGTDVLRKVLDTFEANGTEGEYFNDFYDRIGGKDHFYHLLKPLADLNTLTDKDYYDWEHEEKFKTEIGVGECAGVQIDLVATLLYESEEKLANAGEALEEKRWADSIYHSYAVFISTAKALLLGKGVHCNTQTGILNDFDTHFAAEGFRFSPDFKTMVLNINKYKPSESFATTYFKIAESFTQRALKRRDAINRV
jgi:sulfite reductase (ferredoxin)